MTRHLARPAGSAAASHGRHDRQCLAGRNRGVETLEESNVVIGHEHVDEAAELAVLVEDLEVQGLGVLAPQLEDVADLDAAGLGQQSRPPGRRALRAD